MHPPQVLENEGYNGVTVDVSLGTLPVQDALVLTATYFLPWPVLVPGSVPMSTTITGFIGTVETNTSAFLGAASRYGRLPFWALANVRILIQSHQTGVGLMVSLVCGPVVLGRFWVNFVTAAECLVTYPAEVEEVRN